MGSGGSTSTTKVPKELREQLSALNKDAVSAGFRVSGDPFGEDFVAQPGPGTLSGLGDLQGLVPFLRGQGFGFGRGAMDLANQQIRGDFLSPDSNPHLQANLDAFTRRAEEGRDKQLSNIDSQFAASGGANLRQAFENSAVRENSDQLIDETILGALMQNFNRERLIQQSSPQLFNAGSQAVNTGALQSLLAGQGQTAVEQASIDNELAKFFDAQEAPFRPIVPVANILNSSRSGSNTTTGGMGGLQQALSGVLGGAATGGAIGSAFPGIGTGVGAIGGGLAGGLLPLLA